jgi:hypothetical protein
VFALTSAHRFLLYRGITDFRKGFDGLSGIVRNELDRDPASGEVFVFINRGRNRIKLLQWQDGGFVLYYKRLEKGTIEMPISNNSDSTCKISWPDLVMMIEGIGLKRIDRRLRHRLMEAS